MLYLFFSTEARKMRAVMCLLDAFTCSRTLLNSNASRCLRLFTIEFMADSAVKTSRGGIQICLSSLFVDILLLDKFRVTRRPQGEPTFHIFYYFLAGLESDIRWVIHVSGLKQRNWKRFPEILPTCIVVELSTTRSFKYKFCILRHSIRVRF